MMKVNFFATLRPIVGQKTVEFSTDETTTLQSLFDTILTEYPDIRPEMVDENGQLYRHVHIFVNGRDVHYLPDKMETIVTDKDTINLFPAVGGG